MFKKAQGMSLNVIIIAVLGLLVLVVLAIIFTGRTGVFVRESDKCSTIGGSCVLTKAECSGTYAKVVSGGCDLQGTGKFVDNSVIVRDASAGFCCVQVGQQAK